MWGVWASSCSTGSRLEGNKSAWEEAGGAGVGVGLRLNKICVLGTETHLKSVRVCTCARMWLRVHVCARVHMMVHAGVLHMGSCVHMRTQVILCVHACLIHAHM